MEYLVPFGIMFLLVAFISWRWVKGIDYMQKNHPDYKGEDFLNWGEETPPWETEKNNKNEKTIKHNKKNH